MDKSILQNHPSPCKFPPASGGPAKAATPADKLLTPKASGSLSMPTMSATMTDVREIVTPIKTKYKYHFLLI